MLNQVILVGKITEQPKVETLENGKKSCRIVLEVTRSYKNADGIYDKDFIDCQLWSSVAENTAEWVNKGDTVGIKGHLQVVENKLIVIAEKLTFLTSRKKDEEEK